MRYLLSARVKPGKETGLLRALQDGSFSRGFPYGDLGEVLCEGRVDASGAIRWLEVCYCREYYGVAMEEELPYLETFLTDITITDARNPKSCKGYPVCNDCDCTRKIRFAGEPLLDHLSKPSESVATTQEKATHWLGWKGRLTPEEVKRNGKTGE
jgi:hypothetical protein